MRELEPFLCSRMYSASFHKKNTGGMVKNVASGTGQMGT
jgi:hypothetical protein